MYHPQVNDYVVWNQKNIQGWVYHKNSFYITIEFMVRPKDEINYSHSSIHRNERVLVLCYNNQWNELSYVKSRTSINQ